MKLSVPFFYLTLAIIGLACDSEQNNDEERVVVAEHQHSEPQETVIQKKRRAYPVRYEVKDGHISYRYSGLQSGTEEVYFTNYGMVEIKFTETVRDNPFSGTEEKISLITLMRDSAIYVVDRSTNNARKIDNSLLYESALESPSLDLEEVAQKAYRQKGGSIVDTDTIAGVSAVKWDVPGANSQEWKWKGILMKTYVKLPRNYVRVEAYSIDTLSPLPENIFDLPKDVNVQEGTSMKEWLEDLSKPIKRRQVFDYTDSTKSELAPID